MIKATVICDASYCHTTYTGGWATWIRVDTIPEAIKHSGTFAKQPANSTEAEIMAALNGIWIAKQCGATSVLVQSDCTAVIHLITGAMKSERLKTLWAEALTKHDLKDLALRAMHVKGHTDNPNARSWCNRWCDEKAKDAMRLARKTRKGGRRAERHATA